jgi:hypothetical protein
MGRFLGLRELRGGAVRQVSGGGCFGCFYYHCFCYFSPFPLLQVSPAPALQAYSACPGHRTIHSCIFLPKHYCPQLSIHITGICKNESEFSGHENNESAGINFSCRVARTRPFHQPHERCVGLPVSDDRYSMCCMLLPIGENGIASADV